MKISFCIHDHQPVGNFHDVMESAFHNCYAPMLSVLKRHSKIPLGLHISGTLLEWIEQNHREFIEDIAEMCGSGRMELLTSGRYEPILPVFSRADIKEQIVDFSQYLQEIGGRQPRGLWLTERVWEPQLASLLPNAGVDWAVVDDIHLRRAGVPEQYLFSPFVTEDEGRTLLLLASCKKLRYMIPFSSVEDVMNQLRAYHDSGAEFVFYGDDGEKFGVWPGTHQLCYKDEWLERFFSAVESADWLETVLPSDAADIQPIGPFYVPACSYPEMGQWTTHGKGRENADRAMSLLQEGGMSQEAEVVISGGYWRNFFSIYPESKELHGRIICSQDMVKTAGDLEALHHFWRSQCNCAFWHGVFGGIYLPHLREAVWKEIIRAEHLACLETGSLPSIRNIDLNADGRDETLIISGSHSLVVSSGDDLSLSQLTYIHDDGSPVPLGHLLTRQREAYHERIPAPASSNGVRTIHDGMGSKEDGLSEKVLVDRWRRTSMRNLCMSSSLDYLDWADCGPGVGVFSSSSGVAEMRELDDAVRFSDELESGNVLLSRKLEIGLKEPVIRAEDRFTGGTGSRVGTELCLNLMTGDSRDRFFMLDEGDASLMSARGAFRGSRIDVIDVWRRVRITVILPGEMDIWVTPLESVNMSEGGFESVHQGTAFFISHVPNSDEVWEMELTLSMEAFDGSE